ncbi:MAG: hypothetical protein IKD96_06200 [Oscillospiraceae bacterium]|nr:hypothetical protein [Oscillospiraceae bacterium]
MSFLETLLSGMAGADEPSVDRPCSNCPSSCAFAPEQCSVCKPYKEKLIDALYNVDHLDEFRARYEVVASLPAGATECPHCGAPNSDPFICEYCGMQIQAGDGKIRVTSANDIPNPILQAQDIIFERYQKVVQPSTATDTSGDLLGMLASLLLGDISEQGQATLGSKMTEDEIKEAAEMCRISVSAYLTGLDNGKYPTLPGLKRAAAMESQPQGFGMPGYGSSGLGAGMGAAGLGMAGLVGMMGSMAGMGNSAGMPGMGSSMGMPGMGGLMGGGIGYPQQPYGGTRPPQSPYGSTRPPQPPYGSTRPPQSPYGGTRPPQSPYGNTRPPQSPYGNTRPPQSPYGNTRPPQQQARNTTAQQPSQAANRPQSAQKPAAGQAPAGSRSGAQQKPAPSAAPSQGRTPKTHAAPPEPPSRLSQWADKASNKNQPAPPPPQRQKPENKTGSDERKGKR